VPTVFVGVVVGIVDAFFAVIYFLFEPIYLIYNSRRNGSYLLKLFMLGEQFIKARENHHFTPQNLCVNCSFEIVNSTRTTML